MNDILTYTGIAIALANIILACVSGYTHMSRKGGLPQLHPLVLGYYGSWVGLFAVIIVAALVNA